jgi:hypothetical protein
MHMTSAVGSLAICIFAVAAIGAPASGAGFLAVQVATAPVAETVAAAEPGSSFDTAIVLDGAKNELSGVEAENSYIAAHYPGWHQSMQALLNNNGRVYDRIDVIGPKGESKSLYFDITDWFGVLN